MTNYETLGIRPVINAFATVTKYGGSLMPPEVVQAMSDAANAFVDLMALQRKVGERIAHLTHNEACYVTSGAAAGVALAAAACATLNHPDTIHHFPNLHDLKNEVIIYKSHRNGYDFGIQAMGFTVIEIDSAEDALRKAINDKTSSIFWFQGAMTGGEKLDLADLIQVANEYDVPVIVDAAAQLPPVENLWAFTQLGAGLAIFSGGKDLRGPQSSGLVLGRRDLIEMFRILGNPNHGVGRPMKVGKEELMGVLAAVERYLRLDHEARANSCESIVQMWCDALNPLDGVTAIRDFPNEAGQPLPWCLVTIAPDILGKTAADLVQDFLNHDPAIAVSPMNDTQFHLNPMTLNSGEELIVRDACLELLKRN